MSTVSQPLPPEPPRKKMTASHKALWGLVGFLVLAKLLQILTHMPLTVHGSDTLFSWGLTWPPKGVVFFTAIALLGAVFAHGAAFPGMWDEDVSNRGRIWLPLMIGAVLGLTLQIVDRAVQFQQAYQAALALGPLQVAFPWSLLYYPYVAVCAEILYHLFSLSLTVWFFGTLLLARSWPRATFWTVALLVSLWEPLAMARAHHWALLHAQPIAGIAVVLALIYAGEMIGAVLFRRYGFTAALVLRLSTVFVWHIIGKA
jgi:hypothetical protein